MAMAVESIDAELRLGLPGSGGGSDGAAAKKRRSASTVKSEASGTAFCASPASKMQVVGWPPVGSYRRSTFQSSSSTTTATAAAAKGKGGGETDQGRKKKGMAGGGGLYVKVSMDGAPYLRKVDLRMYAGYRELRDALDALFGCFSSAAADASSSAAGGHFAVAYEDKDGDLMLAGDVPWDMFICSCKKLRIMRGSEAR